MIPHSKMRASSEDWLDLGLVALAEDGPDALTIDGLCRRAGKTKGSFYAHFASHDVFLAALAGHWRQRHTEAVIERVESEGAPEDRMTLLNQIAVRLDARVGHGMRRLAERNADVARVVAEIDERRIGYLMRLHLASGRFSANDARDLALIEHAAFVGLHAVGFGRDPVEMERLYRTFARLTSSTSSNVSNTAREDLPE